MARGRSRAVIGAVAVAVLAVVGAVLWVLFPRSGSSLEAAVAQLPEETLRVSYVDWESVRAASGDIGPDASPREVGRFISRVRELDASPLTALGDQISLYQRTFGVSVLGARWEALGQSRTGQVNLLAVDESVDLDAVERRLARLGYREPTDGAGSGGVWAGGPDLVAEIGGGLTPIVQSVAVRPDERLVAFSDSDLYLSQALDVLDGEKPAMTDVEHVDALVAAAGDPTDGALLAQDFACEALSMTLASEEGQAGLDAVLAERPGTADPLQGYWIGRTGRDLVIAMAFGSPETAESNLETRALLASGPGYGEGGRVDDRFVLEEARTEDDLVVLDAQVRPRTRVMNTFINGPVGFATCG